MQTSHNLSEALETFADNLVDIRKACVENVRDIYKQYMPYKKMLPSDKRTEDTILKHINFLIVERETEHYIRTIKRIDARSKPYRAGNITDNDIARAKEVLLTELYDGRLFGRKIIKGLCPFHNEKTPSFTIYTKNNRFKCFGCGEYGDSIAFVMKRDACDFITAIKKLI